jgi:hypothetical protein
VRKDAELIKKRNEVKQEITAGMNRLLMGLIFEYTSRLIQKLTRNTAPPPFHYTVIVAALIIQLPGLLTAILLNETRQYSKFFLITSLALEFAVLANVVGKINVNYVLRRIRDHIIDAIESVDNLSDLLSWLSNLWVIRKQIFFGIAFGIIFDAFSIAILSLTQREFVGLGATISGFLGAMIVGVPIYYIFQMILLPLRLSPYQYNLFEASPIHSEVLRQLSLALKNYTFVITICIAFFTFLFALNFEALLLNIMILIIGWIPLTVQYLSNRFALNRIARHAKWKTLKEIEAKIKDIQQNADLADKETMERITRLMDYHDRVNATHDAALEVRARLSFLNQILLTLLGYFAANIDSILKFISKFPFFSFPS